jgi:hypothetical protein
MDPNLTSKHLDLVWFNWYEDTFCISETSIINGLVERANGVIITGIMKSIFNLPKGKWPDELVKVVWNHNIVVSRSTGFTPFKLLFGDEAITPEEARIG